ncbi:MAG: ribosome maturation factor RimM [Candidatus Berkiellales bacterium]
MDNDNEVAASSFVIVGQIGAPYGVQGWHHVRSFTQPLANILKYKQWYLQIKESFVPFTVKTGRQHGQGLVVQFEGVSDRDVAATLSLCHVGVLREELAPLRQDEFYWADLAGLQAKTIKGEMIGKIQYLYQNCGADIMVITHQGKEQHIPFVMHDTVKKVDLTEKSIEIDWELACGVA